MIWYDLLMTDARKAIRKVLGLSERSPSMNGSAYEGEPEITLNAYDEDVGRVGTVDIFFKGANHGMQWLGTVRLNLDGQEPRILAEDQYLGDSYEEALDAAVLLANDLLNQQGLFAEM